MSPSSAIFAVNAFSLIVFLLILGNTLQSKKTFRDFSYLLFSSFIMFVVFFLFYFENEALVNGNRHYFLTFVTYFAASFSLGLITGLILSLYEDFHVTKSVIYIISLYSTFAGMLSLLDSYAGTFITRQFYLAFIYIIPLSFLLVQVIKRDKKFYSNVFVIQVTFISLIFIIRLINLLTHVSQVSFSNPTQFDVILNMFGNMLTYGLFLSYVFKRLQITTDYLDSHRRILENSLSEAKKLSETDSLTGLYNRRKTEEMIYDFYEVYNMNNKPFSIIMIDVDSFKAINDTYGHNHGDDVLKFISSSFYKILRDFDVVGRWGGDEFLVILPNTERSEAMYVVKKIRKYFKVHEFIYLKQPIKLSYGVSTSTEFDSINSLIEDADRNMYQDKEKSKEI